MSWCGKVTRPGSSPLARGLLRVVGRLGAVHGIIPARAGFTPPTTAAAGPAGDHPRSRGVYHFLSPITRVTAGSSPLARGLLDGSRGLLLGLRIIPARAGFTARLIGDRRGGGDHPRSRGVYLAPGGSTHDSPGSSPLARGLLVAVMVVGEVHGIIPARAGFT